MSAAVVCLVLAMSLMSAPAVVAAQSADPANGAELFRLRGCAECHASDLARLEHESRSLPALAAALWNHFPQMGTRIRASQANRPYLTSQEMRDLVAFLSSGTAGAARTDADLVGEPGDAKRGEQLVTVKGCLQCHSLSRPARGRADSFDDLKGIDSPWSVAAQMWNHSFLMQLETQAQKRSWARLSPAEMADVLAFIQAQMRAH